MFPLWYGIPIWTIAGTAVVGNFAVISLIATRKRLRTSVNWFVFSLAVADLCVGFIAYSVYFLCDYGPPCEEIAPVYIGLWTSLFASILSLCAMITDRYVAVVWPMKYRTLMQKNRMKLSILLTWAFSLVFSLIGLWAIRSEGSAERIYSIVATAFLYVLPSIVLSAFTVQMLATSRRHSKRIRSIKRQLNFNQLGPAANFQPKTRAIEFISTRLTAVLVTIFNITYFSYACCTICHHLKGCELPPVIFYIKPLLLLLNSALNPVVYSLIKPDIRKELKRIVLVAFKC